MSLADLTALMSKVGKANPALVGDRNVALFIQACIEQQKIADAVQPKDRAPLAPCDFLDV